MSDREKPPFVLLTILFLGICSPLTCQTPTVPLSTEISPPLEDDLRLDKKISATERVITLAELTRHFSDAKITLAVSNECREQKIHLRLRNRSLRSVMKALADWLPGDWIAENKGKTYRLIRKPSYVIKCDRWWRRFLEGREEAIKRMKMAYLKALKQDGISHDESGKINTDETLVRGGAGLTALCRALPEDLLERSVDTLDLRPRYSKDYIVSSSELTKIATCKVKISDLTADAQKIIEKMFANSPSASQITQLRFFASPGGWNIAFTNDQGGAREILSRGAGLPLLNDALISLNQAGLEQALKWHGYVPAKTPSNWQWLVETQKRSFWNKPPARRNPPVFGFPDRSEVMDRLARQKNMDFIEDVYAEYSRHFTPSERDFPVTGTVEQELNRLMESHDIDWKKSNDLILIRNNRWYRDDRLEVSETDAKRWDKISFMLSREETSEEKRVRLVAEAEVSMTLTPWQLMNGFRFMVSPEYRNGVTKEQYDEINDPSHYPQRTIVPDEEKQVQRSLPRVEHANVLVAQRILYNLGPLHFLGQLSSVQRERLLGEGLLFSDLTTAQREEAIGLNDEIGNWTKNALRPFRLQFVTVSPGSYAILNQIYKIEPTADSGTP